MINIAEHSQSEKLLANKIYYLTQNKLNFTLTETTGSSMIVYYDKHGVERKHFYAHDVYSSPDDKLKKNYNANLIPNLCRRVLADAKLYLKSNPLPVYDRNSFVTRDHNPKMIQTISCGDIIHEIDINKFYWTEGYNRKFIQPNTYREFLQHRDARLIAMGNLAKTKIIKHYHEGKIAHTETISSPFAAFFYAIICAGFEIYCKVDKAIDNKIFYFQTDAFWVQPSLHTERKIRAVLDTYNLDYKINRFKIKERGANHLVATNLATGKDKMVHFFNN